MELPIKLQNDVIEFLKSLPNIDDSQSQRALIKSAGLDSELEAQIQYANSLAQFIPLLVTTLAGYGKIESGQYALIAVLEAAKSYIGQDGKAHCEVLIRKLQTKIESYDNFANGEPQKTEVLIIAANPMDTSSSFLDLESNKVKDILENSGNGNSFGVHTCLSSNLSGLRLALKRIRPKIVHFYGSETGSDGIYLKDLLNGPKLLTCESLRTLFKKFADNVECVVLSLCYREDQAEAISDYISYVIGIRNSVDKRISNQFTNDFYTSQLMGESYRDSCNQFIQDLKAMSDKDIPADWLPVIKNGETPKREIKRKFWAEIEVTSTKEDFEKVRSKVLKEIHEITNDPSIKITSLKEGSLTIRLEGKSIESLDLIKNKGKLAGLQILSFENEIDKLLSRFNCFAQEEEFLRSINSFAGRLGAFLVSAKTSQVQRWLVNRLARKIPGFTGSKKIRLNLSFFAAPEDILQTLSRALGVHSNNKEEVIRCLSSYSQHVPVILAIYGSSLLPPKSIDYLSWLWSALVEQISCSGSLSGGSSIFLFLLDDDTENLLTSNFEFTKWAKADPPERIVILPPLNHFSIEDVQVWLSMPSVNSYLAELIGREWVDMLIHEDIETWNLEPLQVLDRICDTFGIEGGLSDVARYWDL